MLSAIFNGMSQRQKITIIITLQNFVWMSILVLFLLLIVSRLPQTVSGLKRLQTKSTLWDLNSAYILCVVFLVRLFIRILLFWVLIKLPVRLFIIFQFALGILICTVCTPAKVHRLITIQSSRCTQNGALTLLRLTTSVLLNSENGTTHIQPVKRLK